MSALRRAVLGIDAAWTDRNDSGVAAVVESELGWRLARVANSYEAFCGSREPQELLRAARATCGAEVVIVAVDMPLARTPIISRRASDLKISEEYGSRWASTHSPSALRPGKVADRFRERFEAAGYPLRTAPFSDAGLVEAYPHPALIEFCRADRRLCYKEPKRRTYWPDDLPGERLRKLREEWTRIIAALEVQISGVESAMPIPEGQLKPFEDKLDAIVCAAVAIAILEGRARPRGDDDSAIWVPDASN